MLSNYPPGVTGLEYEISGPTFEAETVEWCSACEAETDGLEQAHPDKGHWFVCNTCGSVTDLPDEEPEFDADRYNDEAEDRKLDARY